MQLALVTTTIGVPKVLRAYVAIDGNVFFIVAGDKKTPPETVDLCSEIGAVYMGIAEQDKFTCSQLIGYNKIQRRNLGFLKALQMGADIVVSVDDDNLPTDNNFFSDIEHAFNRRVAVEVMNGSGWVESGSMLLPPTKHRGVPFGFEPNYTYDHVINPKVGVVAGICLGDTDVDAATRLAAPPAVYGVHELLRTGFVTNPEPWTMFNSQASAVRREFIPAWFMWPLEGGNKRYDDIFSSLVVQRVMRDRSYRTHFGKPFVIQQRHPHNLIEDLRREIDGYENVTKLAYALDHIQLLNKSVVDDCRRIWETIAHLDFVTSNLVVAAFAYLDDCEQVL